MNLFSLFCSYYFSRLSGRTFHIGSPAGISVEPTTACNLRCPECPSGLRSFTRPTGNMKYQLFDKIIEELGEKLFFVQFYFQGEPFLNPSLLQMIDRASKKKIYTIVSTNGHFFSDETARKTVESGLDRLIISIDGITQQTYESYRKEGNLSTVLEGARQVVKWRKKLNSNKPYIIFQFLLFSSNENETNQVKELASSIGADEVKFKTAQIYDFEKNASLIPQNNKLARYKKSALGNYVIKNPLLNHCWKMWHSSVITWDGKVVPCCFDKDASYKMGNLTDQNFLEIWKGEAFKIFRGKILKAREQIDICSNCTEGTKIWI